MITTIGITTTITIITMTAPTTTTTIIIMAITIIIIIILPERTIAEGDILVLKSVYLHLHSFSTCKVTFQVKRKLSKKLLQ